MFRMAVVFITVDGRGFSCWIRHCGCFCLIGYRCRCVISGISLCLILSFSILMISVVSFALVPLLSQSFSSSIILRCFGSVISGKGTVQLILKEDPER